MSKFYVKATLPTGELYITPITDENVFTTCPCCDEEAPVNLMLMAISIATGRDLEVIDGNGPSKTRSSSFRKRVQRL